MLLQGACSDVSSYNLLRLFLIVETLFIFVAEDNVLSLLDFISLFLHLEEKIFPAFGSRDHPIDTELQTTFPGLALLGLFLFKTTFPVGLIFLVISFIIFINHGEMFFLAEIVTDCAYPVIDLLIVLTAFSGLFVEAVEMMWL